MAFTSAAGKAVNTYLRDQALKNFDFLGFQYEPQLIFNRQIREVVALLGGKYAKDKKSRNWLVVGYARTPITYQMKRFEFERCRLEDTSNNDLPISDWKVRMVHCTFRHVFISPSPSLLEELEELFIVRDLGAILPASVNIVVKNPDKTDGPVYPFEFSVNLEKCPVESFDIFADQSEGTFSIFTTTALVNYPVYVIDKVYDTNGVAKEIDLSLRYGGLEEYAEIGSASIE